MYIEMNFIEKKIGLSGIEKKWFRKLRSIDKTSLWLPERIDNILDLDIRKILIDFISNNREILLPKMFHWPEVDIKTFFYFSPDKSKYIVFSQWPNNSLSLSNINLPWDWIRWMIFVFYYALKANKDKLTWCVIPFKKFTPKMERRRKILYEFYKSFWIEILWWWDEFDDIDYNKEIKMKFELKDPEKLKLLYYKIEEYLQTWNWDF